MQGTSSSQSKMGRPRLSHTKSRTGCNRCKSRRVKCDEQHPVCQRCAIHGAECSYDSQDRDVTPTRLSSHPPYRAAQVPRIEPPVDNAERRLLELRLLHNWHLHYIIGLGPETQTELYHDVFVQRIPALAFQFPGVLSALLGLSAINVMRSVEMESGSQVGARMASLSLPRDTNLQQCSEQYLTLATQYQRQATSDLNAENADALCVTTSMLAEMLFLLSGDATDYKPPTRYLHLARITPSVYKTAWHLLPENSLSHAIAHSHWMEDTARGNQQTYHVPSLLEPVLDWDRFPEDALNEQDRAAYLHTATSIGNIYQAIDENAGEGIIRRRIVYFAQALDIAFVRMVEEGRPRALVMLAYFFASTKGMDHRWTFYGLAEKHVRGLLTIVPRDWQWALEYPVRFIQVTGPWGEMVA